MKPSCCWRLFSYLYLRVSKETACSTKKLVISSKQGLETWDTLDLGEMEGSGFFVNLVSELWVAGREKKETRHPVSLPLLLPCDTYHIFGSPACPLRHKQRWSHKRYTLSRLICCRTR